jgi:hypothetical protein
MSMGLPIVTYAHPDILEVVDESVGYLASLEVEEVEEMKEEEEGENEKEDDDESNSESESESESEEVRDNIQGDYSPLFFFESEREKERNRQGGFLHFPSLMDCNSEKETPSFCTNNQRENERSISRWREQKGKGHIQHSPWIDLAIRHH